MTLRERLDSLFGRGQSTADPVSEQGLIDLARPPVEAVAPDQSRRKRDRDIARQYLPESTVEGMVDGTTYWTYEVRCQFRNRYLMAAYFDGREYQVRVLEPEIVGKYSVLISHVNPNGRLCLSAPNNGAESLQEAFSRSVIWATGFSILSETGEFPFSIHNK